MAARLPEPALVASSAMASPALAPTTGTSPAVGSPTMASPRLPNGTASTPTAHPSHFLRPMSAASSPTISDPGNQPAEGGVSYFPPKNRVSPLINHATTPGGVAYYPAVSAPPPQVVGSHNWTHSPPLQAQGLQSPKSAYVQGPVETSPVYVDVANVFKKTDASFIRQAIRDNWEKCLLGSEYHIAFLLNASLHQASAPTLERGVKDFGQKMVKASKLQIALHLDSQDLDDMADAILAKASSKFLDKALAKRLETIEGRQLINALARAERLGYDTSDIVEQGAGREHVVPLMQQQPQYPGVKQSHVRSHLTSSAPRQTPTQPAPQQHPPAATAPQHPNSTPKEGHPSIVFCPNCQRPCSGSQALQYHISKAVCNKPVGNMVIGKDVCPHCGVRFGSNTGLNYHLKSRVCGSYTEEVHTAILSSLANGAPPPPPQTPTTQGNKLPKPAPAQDSSTQQFYSIPKTRPGAGDDPYARLSPAQRELFQNDIRRGEEHYGLLMRQAINLPQLEMVERLSSLKNSYNTRQSTTRKKYGIHLKVKRTRDEIYGERVRLFGTPDGPQLWDWDQRPLKRSRASTGKSNDGSVTPQPVVALTETPRKRVALSEMGGLGASSATAELTDPTATAVPVPIMPRFSRPAAQPTANGTSEDPMAIDDSEQSDESSEDGEGGEGPKGHDGQVGQGGEDHESEESDGSEGSDGSDDSTDDEDIPAKLPATHQQA